MSVTPLLSRRGRPPPRFSTGGYGPTSGGGKGTPETQQPGSKKRKADSAKAKDGGLSDSPSTDEPPEPEFEEDAPPVEGESSGGEGRGQPRRGRIKKKGKSRRQREEEAAKTSKATASTPATGSRSGLHRPKPLGRMTSSGEDSSKPKSSRKRQPVKGRGEERVQVTAEVVILEMGKDLDLAQRMHIRKVATEIIGWRSRKWTVAQGKRVSPDESMQRTFPLKDVLRVVNRPNFRGFGTETKHCQRSG